MSSRIKISRTSDKIKTSCTAFLLTAVFLLSAASLDIDANTLLRLKNAGNVLSKFMTVDVGKLPLILDGMLTSLSIALAGLALGTLISLVLAFLAAAPIAPHKALAALIKGAAALIRAVPALVWILIVAAGMGFGPTAGMVGLLFPTVGYLVKSFTASIEAQGCGIIEALRATGAVWPLIVIKGLCPGLIRPFASWTAMRLEGNIGESISLGMVGIGGIGSLLTRALGKYDYAYVTTIILVIFATMFTVELSVNLLKKKV